MGRIAGHMMMTIFHLHSAIYHNLTIDPRNQPSNPGLNTGWVIQGKHNATPMITLLQYLGSHIKSNTVRPMSGLCTGHRGKILHGHYHIKVGDPTMGV